MTAVLLYNPLIGEAFEAGDKLYAYETGTTTAVTLYTDDDLSVAHEAPVVADSSGRFAPIYADATGGDLKIKVTDSDDVERFTADPFIVNDLATLTADLSAISASVTSIDGRLTTAESEIDTLQTESSDYESRIAVLEGETSTVEGDFTGDNQSLGTNGFQTIPGGFTIQWGSGTCAGDDAITFPTAFGTACKSVMVTVSDARSHHNNFETFSWNYSTTGCTISVSVDDGNAGVGIGYTWQAIGY